MTRDDHRKKMKKRLHALQKSKPLLVLAIAIPVLLVTFLSLITVQAIQIERLQDDVQRLHADVAQAESQRAFYREAYQVILADTMRLSRIYGGQADVLARVEQLRKQELSYVHGENLTTTSYALSNPGRRDQYVRRGIIVSECLPGPVSVSGITNRTLFSVDATGEPVLYVDGNRVEQVNGTLRADIALAPGLHELTLVGNDVKVERLYIEAVSVGPEQMVADLGENWAVFDCKNASVNTTFSGPGAIRVYFQRT